MPELPVDLLHWLVAVAPIIVLLILLGGLAWKAQHAGPIAMLIAGLTAVLIFRAPLETLAVGVGTGVWDAVLILAVVWSALLLYRVTDAAGGFDALRTGIEHFSRNKLFLVLAFGWVFTSFLQGVAGFGVPVAVAAPLLVTIGVRPVLAVVIPLIGHAWANVFGTLGVAWLATNQVVDLDEPITTAFQAALLLWIPNLLGAFTIAWLFGRWDAVRHAWPFVLIISAIHGGGQLAIVLLNPSLSAFIPSAVALLALYPLSRWNRYGEPTTEIPERPAMAEDGGADEEPEPPMSFNWSLVPYGVLTIAALVPAVPALQTVLESIEVGLPFPETTTGYGAQQAAQNPYAPVTPLTHPTTPLLVAALVSWLIYRAKGFYTVWKQRTGVHRIWRDTASDAIPASVAIVFFLVLAQVLEYSGQTEVIAVGISLVVPTLVFAFLSNIIGALGSFMTSSNTSSNVLFSGLQQNIAASQGLPEPTIIAAQSAGGAIGNAIAPSNIVLGTTTAGIGGQVGAVLRLTLPWVAVTAIVVGAATLLLVL